MRFYFDNTFLDYAIRNFERDGLLRKQDLVCVLSFVFPSSISICAHALLHCHNGSVVYMTCDQRSLGLTNPQLLARGSFHTVWNKIQTGWRLWFLEAPLFLADPVKSVRPAWVSAISAVLDAVPYKTLATNPSQPEDDDNISARQLLNEAWRIYFDHFGIDPPEYFPVTRKRENKGTKRIMSEEKQSRDLVLAPNEYLYIQDVTKGQIKTLVGPTVVNPSPQERPVVYDPSQARFRKVDRLEQAVRVKAIAVEGYYLVLKNPAEGDKLPEEGAQNTQAPDLMVGRKVNIPGPAHFALWPGQEAKHVRGHNLRSNEYLIVRVYNEDEAERNWQHAVVKPATGDKTPSDAIAVAPPDDLSVGREFVIKGTDVSFYIPPTGISVIKGHNGGYVRDAVTLERLEYCILVAENGRKRYERGPQVVFPEPTETFRTDDQGNRKFRATELSEQQALHIKVTAPYTDEAGVEHKQGDELFISGRETTIYFPREEHSILTYDGHRKHHAVQIPAGEARYVMSHASGSVSLERGPRQLLADPRKERLVRRVLSDKQCQLWYPGNTEVLEYNRVLREIQAQSSSPRTNTVSEGDIERLANELANYTGTKGGPILSKRLMAHYASAGSMLMDESDPYSNQDIVADQFSRGEFVEPKSVTPMTKLKGVPSIEVWTGYAVKVVAKSGNRRIEVGPKNLLLEYDESLEVLELSTGKPKTTDNLLKTVYLRVANNKVSDIAIVETKDHVNVKLKLSLRVGFEGDPNKWFDVENYVKYLCDHVRSVLKGTVRRMEVEQFYETAVDVIRDTILGKPDENKTRPGMAFPENGMRVTDVEVLMVEIADAQVADLLRQTQHDVVQGHITVRKEEQALAIAKRREELKRERLDAEHATAVHKDKLNADDVARTLELDVKRAEANVKRAEEEQLVTQAREAIEDAAHAAAQRREKADHEQSLSFSQAEQALYIERLLAETKSIADRFAAVDANFSTALMQLADKDTMVKVAEAWNYQHVIGGKSLSDALTTVFRDTPIASLMARISAPVENGNGIRTDGSPASA